MSILFTHSQQVAVGDAVRIITVLELLAVLGLACAILGVYFMGNLHISRADPENVGALPRYVMSMAISYALLTVFGIAEIQGYYGTALTWRAPIGFVAANFGIYACANLLLFENSRLDLRDQKVHLEGTPTGEGR